MNTQIQILVQRGYHPDRISLPANTPAQLTFLRKESGTCSKEVVIPSLGIRKELPENVPVTIDVPAMAAGEIAFTCGMNMMKGSIAVGPSANERPPARCCCE